MSHERINFFHLDAAGSYQTDGKIWMIENVDPPEVMMKKDSFGALTEEEIQRILKEFHDSGRFITYEHGNKWFVAEQGDIVDKPPAWKIFDLALIPPDAAFDPNTIPESMLDAIALTFAVPPELFDNPEPTTKQALEEVQEQWNRDKKETP